MGDLVAGGVLVPSWRQDPGYRLGNVEVLVPGGGSGGDISLLVPHIHESVALKFSRADSVRAGQRPSLLDFDEFAHDLEPLDLPPAVLKALNEALRAFRAGLYLACLGLVGLVSEAASLVMARGLAKFAPDLATKLDVDRTALAQTQRALFDEVRKGKGLSGARTTCMPRLGIFARCATTRSTFKLTPTNASNGTSRMPRAPRSSSHCTPSCSG